MGDDATKCLDHPDNKSVGTNTCDGKDWEKQEYDETEGFKLF